MSDEELTTDATIGIRVGCQFCSWKSESFPFGDTGEASANDQLAQHQIKDHPRDPEGSRIGVYIDE